MKAFIPPGKRSDPCDRLSIAEFLTTIFGVSRNRKSIGRKTLDQSSSFPSLRSLKASDTSWRVHALDSVNGPVRVLLNSAICPPKQTIYPMSVQSVLI